MATRDLPLETFLPIEDYALIGDCRSAALVGKNGSIDWLCLPRFDSPAVFAAILDPQRGGHFAIRPTASHQVRRRYVPDTNVLETEFETTAGRVRLTDLMPIFSEEDLDRMLCPSRFVLRAVECLAGEVEIEVAYHPRPDFGRRPPRINRRGALGLYCTRKGNTLILRSEIPLALTPDRTGAEGKITLRKGERRFLALTFNQEEIAVLPPLGEHAADRIARTVSWWREWAARCTYDGPYRESVVRSALVLKLMIYSASGAVIAAPTTSLPETIGGSGNWDYRFCWLRDASMTLRALFGLGYRLEGGAFLSWLVHTTRLTLPELAVLYNVYGETRIREETLPHFSGYRNSRPVRIGNLAASQLQLDTYGELIDAVSEYVNQGHGIDRTTARVLVRLGRTVCRQWRRPDEGIWEIRTGRYHHTLSKVMCWVALDRLLHLHHTQRFDMPAGLFSRERDAIRKAIEENGYNRRLGSYVSVFQEEKVDASLLLLPLFGYVDSSAPRMRSTYAHLCRMLKRDGLVFRSAPADGKEGLPAREGAFAAASFWDVAGQALRGEVQGAHRNFEQALSHANDVGLFAEEIDPRTGGALGNFPQAYTHIGLINAAVHLARHREKPRTGIKDAPKEPDRP